MNEIAKIYKTAYEKTLQKKDPLTQKSIQEGGSSANKRAIDLFIEEVLDEAEKMLQKSEAPSE